jgi:hypothetical protein
VGRTPRRVVNLELDPSPGLTPLRLTIEDSTAAPLFAAVQPTPTQIWGAVAIVPVQGPAAPN